MSKDWGKPPWEIMQEPYEAGCFFVWRERYILFENELADKHRRDMGLV